MGFGLIIIGDEILSGKRQDKHLEKVIAILKQRGLQLDWAEYVGDKRERITATLQRSFAGDDVVFSTGGIGATPDDHTRQCAAAALNLPLVLHPTARNCIQDRIRKTAADAGQTVDLDSPDNLQRLKMGEFPQGAECIPNPYNNIPGFMIQRHYFVPGFPVMAWPMIEWVLDTHYAHLFHQHPEAELSYIVYGAMEASLTPLMEAIEAEFPGVKVFSLPSVETATQRRHIELGVKGEQSLLSPAFARLQAGLEQAGAEFVPAVNSPAAD